MKFNDQSRKVSAKETSSQTNKRHSDLSAEPSRRQLLQQLGMATAILAVPTRWLARADEQKSAAQNTTAQPPVAPQTAVASPGVTHIVALATKEFPRHTEGDIIELKDGRLLLAWGRKQGASDFAPGTIVGAFSNDNGLSWDETPHIIRPVWGDVQDVMSVSLIHTPRGLHLFFLGRGPDKESDTRVYQMLSTDEGATWSQPQLVSQRPGYHILNNARVIVTDSGRLIAPISYVPDSIWKRFKELKLFCLYSDDNGVTWHESQEIVLPGSGLMEPGVAQCADSSLYMTIRTERDYLYESRSLDNGLTWSAPTPTQLVSPSAPSTVTRDPHSTDLWMIWCNNPRGNKAGWRDRNPQSFAVSRDNGQSWGTPRFIESDTNKSFGYFSVDVVGQLLHLTYYDWTNGLGNDNFHMTSLRHRIIPLTWVRKAATSPISTSQSDTTTPTKPAANNG